ncbi:alanine--tRNA ligase [Pseudohaliea rubra]|uniref:Alanine--tRNA ligase n=1 Tax=Pseudohaliea rubra DSM 19751 TaxID=1265313 RepID=A0A095VT56_9GAMM|nr:alanine--tRNA ligase [Pseudohaliea rubra]KGE04540.1 Alanyl-tRNA synthetase [Pseudohaliea rubra DSM 19751]
MKTGEIREAFLAFFEEHGHTRVPSSSLVPANDPTLLFTNAGMNQFKDTFLGSDPRPYSRATSSQRCVRAGGKHNDLENVGYTARHHTFFEMLGNFSFGDYFKREAIQFAWTFLTESLGLPPERLWVTVHISDDEAAKIWTDEIGFPAERLSRLDEDNFWQMGDTGPCGPCSEVFYDHGPEVPGGPPGSEDDDLDRYIEIWNLVFMQYNRDASGEMTPLPKPSVDTGMGLERIAAVLQGVHSNYEIDLFQALIDAAAELIGVEDRAASSLRVIADHIRSCAFLVVDGVLPGNEGRGYVLRRILRRAIRHGNKLGATAPFFHRLVAPLVLQMGEAYPELANKQSAIERALLAEEEQFAKTLDHGMVILEDALADLEATEIPGEVVFKLYDTYGFPTDLTNDIARERGLSLDLDGYERAMAAQRERSKEGGSFKVDYNATLKLEGETTFTGYVSLTGEGRVRLLLREGESVSALGTDESGVLVLDATPFYAESGGQVGDTGYLAGEGVRLEVTDTTKAGSHHLHHVRVLEGEVREGSDLVATVDRAVRQRTRLNHSATHLLHAALRQVLGDHVTQKGSLVDSERLRFDFSHGQPVTASELATISALVNGQVRANTPVLTRHMTMDDAMAAGAMALFGEKYGDEVRVLSMGADDFSVELCGGTHVDRTGDIGLFRIVGEGGVAAGVRRLEAVTGEGALAAVAAVDATVAEACDVLKATPANLAERAAAVRAEARELERTVSRLKQKLASAAGGDLTSNAVEVDGVKVLAASVDGADAQSLRDTLDQCKNKLGSAVILLAAVNDGKIALAAGVTPDLTARVKAGDLMREFAGRLGGKGGGRPDMAQGGGSDIDALDATLKDVPVWVGERVATS